MSLDLTMIADLLATSLRLSVPIIFAAIGGVICERSGVFNIALEGCILAGAFGAALGAFLLHSPYGGLLVALIAAGLTGAILAVLAIRIGMNQLVAGIAINMLVIGLTSFLGRLLLTGDDARNLPGFGPIEIPLLSAIPVLGPALFSEDILTYLMFVIAGVSWWVLYRTPFGLNVRAIGEYPQAADSAGINVDVTRTLCVVGGCLLAGLGGAYIVLSQVFLFTEHMSAGKGFIALAAVILGRWNPLGALLACLFFGFCDMLQLHLQFSSPDVPYQLFSMVPFVASFLALVLFAGKTRPPAAIGLKFQRGGK